MKHVIREGIIYMLSSLCRPMFITIDDRSFAMQMTRPTNLPPCYYCKLVYPNSNNDTSLAAQQLKSRLVFWDSHMCAGHYKEE
jgi:hypothetical protein